MRAKTHHPYEVPEDTDRGERALDSRCVIQELIRDDLYPWKSAAPIRMAPTTPTISVPPVQSSTPPVVSFGLFDPPLLLAPARIFTAVTRSVAYATPLAALATRWRPLSFCSVP
jgi:hypothetical protein